MSIRLDINNNMLEWAITRAGLDLEDIITSFPNLEKWLSDEKKPTFKQLQNFAKKVHVPFGYLFLNTPPKETLPIPFFRSTNSNEEEVSINVFDTILTLKQRQDWLTEFLIENGHEALPFVGKFNERDNFSDIVTDLRKTLGLEESWASTFPNWKETLKYLTEKVEEIGIILTFNGVVDNNTHRPIKVEDCRGFVLVNEHAPFMFINASDAKAAQMFTIIHELAHIWIGKSAGFDFKNLQPANNAIEILCDQIAANFLVPKEIFSREWEYQNSFEGLAKYFKVSQIVIARRALDLGLINRPQFFEFYNDYISSFLEKRVSQESGGDFYRTAKRRVNLKFASHIYQAVNNNQLLYKDAYKLTGMKGDTFRKFCSEYFL